MEDYNIEIENILFHGKLENESTKCPGKNFPYIRFKKDLENLNNVKL